MKNLGTVAGVLSMSNPFGHLTRAVLEQLMTSALCDLHWFGLLAGHTLLPGNTHLFYSYPGSALPAVASQSLMLGQVLPGSSPHITSFRFGQGRHYWEIGNRKRRDEILFSASPTLCCHDLPLAMQIL